ncbi:MAG: hypothetical protein JXO72_00555 [Vicinamibacteria bacterium]|nr:hypothetical protein [Vicinamibacteria bacterium]
MSKKWTGVLAWTAVMSVVWVVFSPATLSGAGLALMSVLGFFVLWTLLAAFMRSPLSVAQVIADADREPARAFAGQSESPSGRYGRPID